MTTRQALKNIKKDFANFDLSFIDFFDVTVQDVSIQLYTGIKEFVTSARTDLSSTLNETLEKVLKTHDECVILNQDYESKLNSEKARLEKATRENLCVQEELNSVRAKLQLASNEILSLKEVLKCEHERQQESLAPCSSEPQQPETDVTPAPVQQQQQQQNDI
uniref:Uncharacterized protein n=1 Tax=Cacopsylla melanoneura TaxID=428564 RepID=A0A8D8X5A8_9HEMI